MNTNQKFLAIVAVLVFLTFIQQATVWLMPKMFLALAAFLATSILFFQKEVEIKQT